MKKLLVINGPNLNLLGKREPGIYGSKTLDEISKDTEFKLKNANVVIEWFQSNSESEIVDKIQELMSNKYDGLVINPGAYSHTSIAILDALKAISVPRIEVHISHTNSREEFRQKKITAKGVDAICEGLGEGTYYIGVLALLELINKG